MCDIFGIVYFCLQANENPKGQTVFLFLYKIKGFVNTGTAAGYCKHSLERFASLVYGGHDTSKNFLMAPSTIWTGECYYRRTGFFLISVIIIKKKGLFIFLLILQIWSVNCVCFFILSRSNSNNLQQHCQVSLTLCGYLGIGVIYKP